MIGKGAREAEVKNSGKMERYRGTEIASISLEFGAAMKNELNKSHKKNVFYFEAKKYSLVYSDFFCFFFRFYFYSLIYLKLFKSLFSLIYFYLFYL